MKLNNDGKLTIARLAPWLRQRRLSPVELAQEFLRRIGRLDGRLQSYITVTAELALSQARKAEAEIARGRYRGPLHGIPVCLKDLIHTEGIRTTAGSKILANFRPLENAAVVDRLCRAGAVLLGKTNLHEFAFGPTNVNPHFGAVRNPWNAARISGGSSGGSAAAVVAALALAGLGTDTGGSIRIPAAACGCVGLKPTWGRVPLHGIIPLARSLDHVGPLCRCVEDAAIVLGVIAGIDARDASSFGQEGASFLAGMKRGIRGLRLGLPRHYFFDRVQRDVRRNVLAAVEVLRENGAEVREIPLRWLGDTARLAAVITGAEALAYHSEWLRSRPEDYGADVRRRLGEVERVTAVSYLQAREAQQQYAGEFAAVFDKVDCLAVPALPVTATPVAESEVRIGSGFEDVRLALLRLTRPANLAGLPAISVPCGFSRDGLPTGLQIIGRKGDEQTVLRVAYAFERATRWHERFPQDEDGSEASSSAEGRP